MKKEYEKPTVEILVFDYEIKADEVSGQGEGEFDVGDWW